MCVFGWCDVCESFNGFDIDYCLPPFYIVSCSNIRCQYFSQRILLRLKFFLFVEWTNMRFFNEIFYMRQGRQLDRQTCWMNVCPQTFSSFKLQPKVWLRDDTVGNLLLFYKVGTLLLFSTVLYLFQSWTVFKNIIKSISLDRDWNKLSFFADLVLFSSIWYHLSKHWNKYEGNWYHSHQKIGTIRTKKVHFIQHWYHYA